MEQNYEFMNHSSWASGVREEEGQEKGVRVKCEQIRFSKQRGKDGDKEEIRMV